MNAHKFLRLCNQYAPAIFQHGITANQCTFSQFQSEYLAFDYGNLSISYNLKTKKWSFYGANRTIARGNKIQNLIKVWSTH